MSQGGLRAVQILILSPRGSRATAADGDEGQTIRVCGYRDLLEMKAAAGRGQDLIDIQNLKAARREL